MQFSLLTLSLTALFLQGAIAAPSGELERRGCSRTNSGTHCQGSGINSADARSALADLLSQCQNGSFPGNAKRTESGSFNGVVAYACNGFCRTPYMPCQDAEWSINRVINSNCEGWDSQETRGTWYGIAQEGDNPCGYAYSGKGSVF